MKFVLNCAVVIAIKLCCCLGDDGYRELMASGTNNYEKVEKRANNLGANNISCAERKHFGGIIQRNYC